jgi:hypothetical protein
MTWIARIGAAVAFTALSVAGASADQWNDKTTLEFSEPVMVPGATLAPGKYVFKLANSTSNRHLVQIYSEDGMKLITTTQAVPMRRTDVTGDVVVKLNPTEAGAPIAIKAWFAPGSRYGHEFIYPEDQARQIAQRTKTLVLSTDVPGSDMEKGTLYNYDAEGRRSAWRGDDQTMKEWNEWRRSHPNQSASQETSADRAGRSAQLDQRQDYGNRTEQRDQAARDAASDRETGTASSTRVAAPAGPGGNRESTAPVMHGDSTGTKVSLDDLEEHPERYTGQTVSVTAEVDEVFGPRLFKIDEPHWADLDQEVLVYMPTALAALVREGDRVTVTGTMKPFIRADIQKEVGWLWREPGVEIDFKERPVLAASRIVGGDSNSVLAIEADRGRRTQTGASAAPAGKSPQLGSGSPLTDVASIARGSQTLVGRQVDLAGVKVAQRADAPHRGFWVESGGSRVFVMPAYDETTTPDTGQTVSIEGVLLQMPRAMWGRQAAGMGRSGDTGQAAQEENDQIYVYATSVRPAR